MLKREEIKAWMIGIEKYHWSTYIKMTECRKNSTWFLVRMPVTHRISCQSLKQRHWCGRLYHKL